MSADNLKQADMSRDAVADALLVPVHDDKLDETSVSCCWWCNCCACICGGCLPGSMPFTLRSANCISAFALHHAGMYTGGKYSRDTYNSMIKPLLKKPGFDKKTGVTSRDFSLDSKLDKDVKIHVRVFTPKLGKDGDSKEQLPIMIFVHGGGWVIGSSEIPMYHNLCQRFAKNGYVVVSLDYRLAPENPFPAGLFDVYEGCQWVFSAPNEECFKRADFSNIMISGDSAGGQLAFVMTQLARDGLGPDLKPDPENKMKFSLQVLLYPATFMRKFVKEPAPSSPPFLPRLVSEFFGDSYVAAANQVERNKIIDSDRRLQLSLSGFHDLPKTIIVSGGLDYLRFENRILAAAMTRAGVLVIHHEIPHQPHGFMTFEGLKATDDCFNAVMKDVKSFKVNINV
jgi:acetyl esterase